MAFPILHTEDFTASKMDRDDLPLRWFRSLTVYTVGTVIKWQTVRQVALFQSNTKVQVRRTLC